MDSGLSRVAAVLRLAVIVGAVTLAVVRFLAIDSTSHSNSDTLRPWIFQATIIAVVAALLVVAIGRLSRRGRGG